MGAVPYANASAGNAAQVARMAQVARLEHHSPLFHRHHGAHAAYTLCLGYGGLTNVKQRLWDCVQRSNRSGHALLPP